MDFLFDGFAQAFKLIMTFDGAIASIVLLTLVVSVTALAAAAVVGIPIGTAIGLFSFRGRNGVIACSYALMSLPTVVIGLLLYGLLSRLGPFGAFDLLYTPYAVWLGQFVLVIPLVVSLTISTIEGADRRIYPTALTLGATRLQAAVAVLRESRGALISMLAVGFGRVISEVGCALIVGGNIKDRTRVITTAVTLETGKGEFATALALGIILMIIALVINLVFFRFARRGPTPSSCQGG